mgnify:CR=1 FL=1
MIAASPTSHRKGIFILLLTTVIWGTSFPVLKDTLSSLPPSVLILVRYSIAAIALLPWLRNLNGKLLRDGALLGSILFFETGFALTGMETISASRSAFLVGMNVIFVPLIGIFMGRPLARRVLIATGIAVAGISIMSLEGSGIRSGDLLTLVSALGIAIYILLLEAIAPRHSFLALASVQIWTMVLLGGLWAVPEMLSQAVEIGDRLPQLIYLGLVVTIGPLCGQALGQRWVPAHEAALLYTMEPVFATLFSFLILGEGLGLRGAIGAACILVATVVSQYRQQHS